MTYDLSWANMEWIKRELQSPKDFLGQEEQINGGLAAS
jgi:hypothetical protein